MKPGAARQARAALFCFCGGDGCGPRGQPSPVTFTAQAGKLRDCFDPAFLPSTLLPSPSIHVIPG
ncbi:MAG: hypothetical protein LBQ55_06725 [Treponema sp.]|nr:hypothetical protein [Treponema sp.]